MFEQALTTILRFEGGYVNDPDDPGGATNKGIIQKTYDSYRRVKGLDERPVRQITDEEVREIYERDYWRAVRCDKFSATHGYSALAHFDCAVNQGSFLASKLLQNAINVTHEKDVIKVDGIIGPKTLQALSELDDRKLCTTILRLRKTRYLDLFNRNPKLLKWKKSYIHRLNSIAIKAGISWRWVE